jgi:hypothetical protein
MSTWNANSGRPDSNRRRSQRVIMSLPVTVRSEGLSAENSFVEETQTLVVNAHGAMIALTHHVDAEQTLLLINGETKLEQLCNVSYVGSPSGGKTQVGLKFIPPYVDFWAISFPPDNSTTPELEAITQQQR